MPRNPNSTTTGGSFSLLTKLAVWGKGSVILGHDTTEWRRDRCGAAIQYSKYGDTSSKHGWEIDHIFPVAAGGQDNLDNLQPLQWSLNREKGDSLFWSCPVLQA